MSSRIASAGHFRWHENSAKKDRRTAFDAVTAVPYLFARCSPVTPALLNSLRLVPAGLGLPHPGVAAVQGEKALVGALLDDAAFLQHQDTIRIPGGGETM